MKKKLRIRLRFEATRLGAEHLHKAYEFLVPVQRVRLRTGSKLEITSPSRALRERSQSTKEKG